MIRRSAPILLVALFLVGCGGEVNELNDRNPYYRQGQAHLSDGKYEQASTAFRDCLKYSPKSYLAHLQLGLLHEDHLRDLPKAIVHYREFIALAPADNPDVPKVKRLLSRVEEAYFLELQQKYAPDTSVQPPAATLPPVISNGPATPSRPVVLEAPPIPTAPPAPLPATPNSTYQVKTGDSLSLIANKVYGDADRWPEIYKANRAKLRSPNDLKVGQVLTIPR